MPYGDVIPFSGRVWPKMSASAKCLPKVSAPRQTDLIQGQRQQTPSKRRSRRTAMPYASGNLQLSITLSISLWMDGVMRTLDVVEDYSIISAPNVE
jgi:hypothetical protein